MTLTPAAAETRQNLLDTARSLMLTKGYSAVGLAEIVAKAGVPKGSFYYYFKSKEDFGQAMLDDYFGRYAERVDAMLNGPGTAQARLLAYFAAWASSQTAQDQSGRCLATKLGGEVCDLSEGMRGILDRGAKNTIAGVARVIEQGHADGSIRATLPAEVLAKSLYELWMGASLMAKLDGSASAFDTAITFTQSVL